MIRGMAGMAGIILVLLMGLVAYLHLRSATPARAAAMGLVRERPEAAVLLGMPFERTLAINMFDLMPGFKVEGAYRYVLFLRGPEGMGLAEVHLNPLVSDGVRVRLRQGLFGEWQELPRALIPERSTPQAGARMQHALTLLQKGDPESAREVLNEVLQLQPLLPGAWYLRAVASRDLGEHEKALADARWALELEHPDPELGVLMEQVLPEHAPPHARVAIWTSFLAYAPHSPIALARQAQARAEAGDLGGAVRFLEQNCLNGSASACKSLRELVDAQVVAPPPAAEPPSASAP